MRLHGFDVVGLERPRCLWWRVVVDGLAADVAGCVASAAVLFVCGGDLPPASGAAPGAGWCADTGCASACHRSSMPAPLASTHLSGGGLIRDAGVGGSWAISGRLTTCSGGVVMVASAVEVPARDDTARFCRRRVTMRATVNTGSARHRTCRCPTLSPWRRGRSRALSKVFSLPTHFAPGRCGACKAARKMSRVITGVKLRPRRRATVCFAALGVSH